MSSDAEREAEHRYPTGEMDAEFEARTLLRDGFKEGAAWERSRPVTDSEVQAAAKVIDAEDVPEQTGVRRSSW